MLKFHRNISKIKSKTAPVGQAVPWLLLITVTGFFTVMLYPTLVSVRHVYQLGDIADTDVKATKDFFIEDSEATDAKRGRAVSTVLTVYDHDVSLKERLTARIHRSFEEIRTFYENEKTKFWAKPFKEDEIDPADVAAFRKRVDEQVLKMKDTFANEIGISVSDGAFRLLQAQAFSTEIESLISQILSEILENGVVANKEILLREADKGITLRMIGSDQEKTVHNLKPFYGLDQAKTMVRVIGASPLKDLDYNLRNLVVDFAQQMIQPNITLNRNETEKRKKQAAEEIKPILYQIKTGEMILREGERVTPIQHLKLKAMEEKFREERRLSSGFGAAILLVCLLITTYLLHLRHLTGFQRNRNKNMLFIACVMALTFFMARLAMALTASLAYSSPSSISASSLMLGVPVAWGAMVVSLFIGYRVALALAMVTAVGCAIIFNGRLDLFVYFLINGSMAAYWTQHCRERMVFIKSGCQIGLLNVLVVTAMNIYAIDFSWGKLLWDCAFAFIGGIGTGIITSGIVPLVEIVFDYTTDIKLLELANLDRPILRRLMLEAPGTYHHSMIVGSLVEAAAAEIGANSLLGKVCGYYHDIGKVQKPLYFIENQTNGRNKHDKLAPTMSKRILVAHVKDGVEMARKHRLGQVLVETIQQSHGTSLISFFYEKARKQMGEDAVKADDFRYPGPRPQTREAGLVMLADVVEAASRTLDNPTPSRINGLVQRLINKVFSDGQLDECELTLKDLHKIAKSFNQILYGIHHHRIDYPDGKTAGVGKERNGKEKNGRSDRKQAMQHQDSIGDHSADDAGHLKRLGLS